MPEFKSFIAWLVLCLMEKADKQNQILLPSLLFLLLLL